MRDMRPGSAVPEDLDRAAAVERDVHAYNRRFSGEPRSLWEKVRDLPGILTHLGQNATIENWASLLLRGRMLIPIIGVVLYAISPFDLLPESLLGVFGLLDDFGAFIVLGLQMATAWRAYISQQEAAPIRDDFNRRQRANPREGLRMH